MAYKYARICSCIRCRKFTTTSGLFHHYKHGCENIEGSIIPKPKRVAWNKGLTKENNKIVADYGKKISALQQAKVAAGTFIVSKPSAAFRKRLSALMSLKNRGGKSKWYEVSGQKLQGTWERNLAIKFNELGIKWIKPTKTTHIWKYKRRGKIKSYTPDFYLPGRRIWLEVKGFWWGSDKAKMRAIKRAYPRRKLLIIEKAKYELILKAERASVVIAPV
jgi:hypothetical protein